MSVGGKHTVYPVTPKSQRESLKTFQFPMKNAFSQLQRSTINQDASKILNTLPPITVGKPWERLGVNIIEKIISSGGVKGENLSSSTIR